MKNLNKRYWMRLCYQTWWNYSAQLNQSGCLVFPAVKFYHAVPYADNVTSTDDATHSEYSLPSDNVARTVPVTQSERHIFPDSKTAALYVHWPYCQRRCSYCNFNKYINRNVNHERMRNCLVTETLTLLQLSGVDTITSIFFGGGTPSLAEPATIQSIIDTVKNTVNFPTQGEITLEVNPTILEKEHLRDFKNAGVNRVSIGIQALDNNSLAVLGRDHTTDSALECLHDARELFPSSVSVDLIFGHPGHTLSAWQKELQQLLQICDKHISLYQLTLERGTQLFKMVHNGSMKLPAEDEVADMYKTAVEILKDHGFERYEVSNFAKEGRYSSHNLSYWEGKQYIGVGPGAHGRFVVQSADGVHERHARIQTLEPDNWMWEVEKFNQATRKIVKQTNTEILEELLLVGLRICWGISHKTWKQRCPELSLYDIFDTELVSSYRAANLIQLDDRGLRATPLGMNVLDSIIPHLILLLHEALAR